ncbi:MAG: hypothetical protein K1V80_03195 [Muribaculaceae bacterium]
MHIGPLPLPIAIFSLVMCIWHLYSTRQKKKSQPPSGYDPLATTKSKNIASMQDVVDAHREYTAEVFSFYVSGIKRVKTFRLLNPGDELEIRAVGNKFKVFAFGEYMNDLIIPKSSHIPRLFKDKIPFETYLGGRDLDYIYNDEIDFASIIIFYKIDGVPPTKVIMQ